LKDSNLKNKENPMTEIPQEDKLTDEELLITICADCLQENKFTDEDCRNCQRNLRAIADAAVAKAMPLIEKRAREDERKDLEKWLFENAIITTTQIEVIPDKLTTSEATYGFHTAEWWKLLETLRLGQSLREKK
jgi:hypothetical protein